jgi:predicted small lipoprotein YifL
MKKALFVDLLLGLVLLAGCGQKGGLYLPHQGKTSAKQPGAKQNPAAHRNTGPGTATPPGDGSYTY